jgi:hypothetical protein
MNRSTTNFIVDAVALAAMMLLGATGALIRYVLPPGSGHFSRLWGMDRHEWGHIHFWIAVALLCAVALHFVLHWQWIISMIRGRAGSRSAMRMSLAVVGLLVLIGLMVSPFLGQVQKTSEPPHKMQSDEHRTIEINGSMTLHEVEQQTGVPAAVILKELGLPANLPADERLGRLRKQYGFQMHDIQEIVQQHQERSQR